MNKVWKQFLKNIMWPIVTALYMLVVVFGAVWLEEQSEGSALLVVAVFIILPTISWLVRDMWQEAKEQVDTETKEMINKLKGE